MRRSMTDKTGHPETDETLRMAREFGIEQGPGEAWSDFWRRVQDEKERRQKRRV